MSGPYSRVYWTVMEDTKFDGVREDVRLFGSWSLMLVVADMAWPSPAFVPPNVPKSAVARLASCGLVDLLPGARYRVHGLAAERNKRSQSGRNAAALRWQSPRNADPMLGKDEAEAKAERVSPAREGLPNLDSTVARQWETATGRGVLASGNYASEYLDDACRRHPVYEVSAAIIRARKQFEHIPDAPSMVAAMRPILDPFPDAKAAAKAEREREAAAASRRGTAATLRRNHELGAHRDEPHGACPVCQEATA